MSATGRDYDFLKDLDNTTCTICAEPYDAYHPAVQSSGCPHIFGGPCLNAWMNSSNGRSHTCPICRAPLNDPSHQSNTRPRLRPAARETDEDIAWRLQQENDDYEIAQRVQTEENSVLPTPEEYYRSETGGVHPVPNRRRNLPRTHVQSVFHGHSGTSNRRGEHTYAEHNAITYVTISQTRHDRRAVRTRTQVDRNSIHIVSNNVRIEVRNPRRDRNRRQVGSAVGRVPLPGQDPAERCVVM